MKTNQKLPTLIELYPRKLYSDRILPKVEQEKLSEESFKKKFLIYYFDFKKCGYFSEAFGNDCVDGESNGTVGDEEEYFTSVLERPNLYPPWKQIPNLNREEIFDLIEILHDHISEPVDGTIHTYNNCGWHFDTFKPGKSKEVFRQRINSILEKLGDGFLLNTNGEIEKKGDKHLKKLLEAPISTKKPTTVDKIDNAVTVFRSRNSTRLQRQDAVRSLADILEYIRPQANLLLTKKDENDIFNIANNFGIRHHNQLQKTDFDDTIWLTWIFYFYLATIKALLLIIEREKTKV